MNTSQPIVIVEDDRDDQETLREVLQQLGVTRPLLFFSECESALQHLLATEQKPFLILCDINLPKINGIEFKQHIDKDQRLRSLSIPFVFLTTSDTADTIEQAYQTTNLQGYFRKENTLAEFKAQLKAILDYWHWAQHP